LLIRQKTAKQQDKIFIVNVAIDLRKMKTQRRLSNIIHIMLVWKDWGKISHQRASLCMKQRISIFC